MMRTNEYVYYMIFNIECSNIDYNKIEFVSEHKYLRIIIDNHFGWDIQIKNVEKKLRSIIPNFYTLRNYVSRETMRMVYFALVESKLRYGVQAWRLAFKNSKSLEISI